VPTAATNRSITDSIAYICRGAFGAPCGAALRPSRGSGFFWIPGQCYFSLIILAPNDRKLSSNSHIPGRYVLDIGNAAGSVAASAATHQSRSTPQISALDGSAVQPVRPLYHGHPPSIFMRAPMRQS
jgi:hypothetical protein